MRSASWLVGLTSFAFVFGFAPLAAAQPAGSGAGAPADTAPESTIKGQAPASAGSNDIAGTGALATSAAPKDDDPSHVNDVSIGAGGLFSAGNSRQVALTSLGRIRLRREEHQLSAAATVNYARAGKVGQEISDTVENYQALLRYDYFFDKHVSAFLQSTARRDRFQGLDLRLNVDPGLAYYFINTKTHRLQGEIGYDFQRDIRREASILDAERASTPEIEIPRTHTLHNARLFVGYENKLRKEVSLVMSTEYLQNFADIGTYRLIVDVGLKSQVSDNFSLATTYTARYENKPLPHIESLDSIASVNLVYSFF